MLRIFLIFFLTAHAAFALTKETAVNQCAMSIDALTKAPLSSLDQETETFLRRILMHLETLLGSLKKTESVEEIYTLRTSCANGFKAARWVIDTFQGAERKPQEQDTKNAPAPEPAKPAATNPPKPS
jgi:hypothetical protein